jgi:hypothetical protein
LFITLRFPAGKAPSPRFREQLNTRGGTWLKNRPKKDLGLGILRAINREVKLRKLEGLFRADETQISACPDAGRVVPVHVEG